MTPRLIQSIIPKMILVLTGDNNRETLDSMKESLTDNNLITISTDLQRDTTMIKLLLFSSSHVVITLKKSLYECFVLWLATWLIYWMGKLLAKLK